MISQKTLRRIAIILTLALGVVGIHRAAIAAQLTLTWSDNSSNENGFNIERRVSTTGSYSKIASAGVNVVSYTDTNLQSNTTYCYRVQAYNSTGTSAYSNERCATTSLASTADTTTYQASVDFSSTQGFRNWYYLYGSGTPMTFVDGDWQGNEKYLLLWARGGHPGNSSDAIRRWKAPQAGSINITGKAFDMDTSCGSGASVYIKKNSTILWQQAIANGNTTGVSFNLTTAVAVGDNIDFGINRGADGYWNCDSTGFDPTILLTSSLSPLLASTTAPSRTSTAGTTQTTLSLTTNVVNDLVDKVGIYRPSTGEWFLDQNGNGTWDGCEIDVCVQSFGAAGALPVVGDWDGSEFTKLGLFLPSTSQWQLDMNGDRNWDGCALDTCQESFGGSGDMPVAGKWTTAGSDRIGTFRTDNGTWYLDASGNGNLDCLSDYCFRFSNYASGDVPVAGDWTGSGTSRVGLYRPSTGQWFLDRNGSRSWNGCSKDTCVNDFGAPGDLPIAGDWSGDGISKIGIFRPSTQEWMLDLNGNGSWDGCDVDLCIAGFGAEGDVPVVGRW
ncbi:MAG: fibronectin type III domain-containing protein [Deltaproteobacteria bacterium]|nr:fibronectin type III domain-containing protein [Deltaproteobacteria bacterium]MDZ4342282.1 fibronectin type III domain-containing protein [Candidatus Binatia bacterium]